MSPGAHMNGGDMKDCIKNDAECLSRADEASDLLQAVLALVIPFIRLADETGTDAVGMPKHMSLVDYHSPQHLVQLLGFQLPDRGLGKEGLMDALSRILQYSVNTWDQGFMDKLYSSTNAAGIAADLVLSVLNTNLHVYQVAPALTIVEKLTSRRLAQYFGLGGDFIGGISQHGGSASNATSLVIARNTLFPPTKTEGNGSLKLVIFSSAESHYSISKAAIICGIGASNVRMVPVNLQGQMDISQLEVAVQTAEQDGLTPFYVNATAGTTVLGAFDPLRGVADICKRHKMWMHVDASWGGCVVFSSQHRHKLRGAELADSITITPHKMLGVPVTCSFLLGADMRKFHAANAIEAGYLFHENCGRDADGEVWDLADMTLQCGRRGDSLKLAMSWIYYGSEGYSRQIDHAFNVASYFASLVLRDEDFVLVSENPPPCLQVCFYFAKAGILSSEPSLNTEVTRTIVRRLIGKGYMIDYAPGGLGCFFRAVVNIQTQKKTVENLLETIRELYPV
ncbi:MAG: hypothetical protein M1839_001460 [Geoglossum umbratile]|nr:MAG: hypothetical protein M1839_001460 [Geoglossum umbratile]